MKVDAKARFPSIEQFGRALLPFASNRSRMLWEEAFTAATTDEPSGAPSPAVASAPTPLPPPSAVFYKQSLGGNLTPPPPTTGPHGMTPTPPPAAPTPTPGPRPATIAQWSLSPVPHGRPTTGPGAPRSPGTPAPAALPAAAITGATAPSFPTVEGHPISAPVDAFDDLPPPSNRKRTPIWIAVGAVALVGVVVAVVASRGSSSEAPVSTEKQAAAPEKAAPPPPAAPAAVAPAPTSPTPAAPAAATRPPAPTPEPPAPPAPSAAPAPAVTAERPSRRHGPASKSRSRSKESGGPGKKGGSFSPHAVPVLD